MAERTKTEAETEAAENIILNITTITGIIADARRQAGATCRGVHTTRNTNHPSPEQRKGVRVDEPTLTPSRESKYAIQQRTGTKGAQ